MEVCKIRGSKHRKLDEDLIKNDGSVRICNLPDVLLQQILSVLPLKDTIRTSILSKRWQYLWTSIPNLDFEENSEENTKRKLFMNSVERVLLLRDSSNIQKFSLKCKVLDDALRINAWISAILRRNIQEIDLNLFGVAEPFVLPHCLFTCESLRVLKLRMASVLKVPTSTCFSSLKILTLRHVTFSDDYATQHLFSGCPVLEDLFIDECNWENIKAVTISAPKLGSVKIHDSDIYSLNISSRCQVFIFCTGLKFFSYNGDLQIDYCLYGSSSVADACIDLVGMDQKPREVAYRVNRLLQELSSVECLTLSSEAVLILSFAKELFLHLPLFNNLTHFILDPGLAYIDYGGLMDLLKYFPHLESLVFDQVCSYVEDRENGAQMPNSGPSCFLSHLKSMEILQFDGDEEELYVIKALLKIATFLDKMIICCTENLNKSAEMKKEAHEKLLMFPKGSTSCRIIFT